MQVSGLFNFYTLIGDNMYPAYTHKFKLTKPINLQRYSVFSDFAIYTTSRIVFTIYCSRHISK